MTISRRSPLALLALAALATAAACSPELVCPGDEAPCSGACVALAADVTNCGACGHTCEAGQTCTLGACAFSDAENCGAFGRACATGERCVQERCVADLYLACFNTGEVREATAALEPAGVPLAVAPGPSGLALLGGELYVASAQPGGAETVARVARDAPAVRVEKLWNSSATPDIQFLAAHGGFLYVSHASLGTLLVLDPNGGVVEEHAFVSAGEPNPNPQGIAFDGDRAVVALNTRAEVAVLDVSEVGRCATPGACIQELARVDVSSLASVGGHAMPARIAVAGPPASPAHRAFVTLWNLDDYWSPPAGSTGRLAAIDLESNALDASAGPGGLVDLGAACLDPADVALQGSTLWVTCGAFDYSNYPEVKILAGGLVPVDLSAAAPAAGEVIPAPDGVAPGELAFCGGTGYVGDRNSGRVFRLDPAAGAVDGVALCPVSNGYAYVADIACGD
jgi:hypothetical protein